MKGTLTICLILAVFTSISAINTKLHISPAHKTQTSIQKKASAVHFSAAKPALRSTTQHKKLQLKKLKPAPAKRAHSEVAAPAIAGVEGPAQTSSQQQEEPIYEESSSVNSAEDSFGDYDEDEDDIYNDEDYEDDYYEGSDSDSEFWNKKSAKTAHKSRATKP